MANPKRKHSKSRTAKRRSQYKVKDTQQVTNCDHCGSAKLMHRACPTCGYYRGRPVVQGADFN